MQETSWWMITKCFFHEELKSFYVQHFLHTRAGGKPDRMSRRLTFIYTFRLQFLQLYTSVRTQILTLFVLFFYIDGKICEYFTRFEEKSLTPANHAIFQIDSWKISVAISTLNESHEKFLHWKKNTPGKIAQESQNILRDYTNDTLTVPRNTVV